MLSMGKITIAEMKSRTEQLHSCESWYEENMNRISENY